MFSATFDPRIENLAYALFTDPLRIQIGSTHNADIFQRIIVVPRTEKVDWLVRFLGARQESVLVFCNGREGCDELARKLNEKNITAMSIHGDLNQEERTDVLDAFRTGVVSVLVATDIASRGLDVPDLNFVVNYDIAKDVESHVHRVGRTGRAGSKGEAYTLVALDDINGAPVIVRALETSNQTVPPDLMIIARKNPKFSTSRKYMTQQAFTNNRFKTVGLGFGENKTQNTTTIQQSRTPNMPHMSRFVKPQHEGTVLQPEKKKFTVIPAKNPQPTPAPKKFEIVPPKNPQPAPVPVYNPPVAQPMMSTQQQLIYQQYQAYLSQQNKK
jgi:superfamily II DNA/RNA helicase